MIMKIEFDEAYGGVVNIPSVALFDKRDLSEDEALRVIHLGGYDDRIIIISKEQYETVFRSCEKEK